MLLTSPTQNTQDPLIGGTPQIYEWVWKEQPYRISYEVRGEGLPVLLLPAFSTVSSRSEMQGLATRLSLDFQVVALDWLGFGQSARPALDYRPDLYHQLLHDFLRVHFSQPISVVAAGHAAGYAMHIAQQQPNSWSKMVLVAPTWKGPLCAMGAPSPLRDGVRELVRSPGLGQLLYGLNTTPGFLKFMYRRHVFVNEAKLTPEFIQQKYQSTQQPGGRFAPAAFVTGTLDPMAHREEFLAAGRSLTIPTLVVIGEQSPPQSRAEMEALAALPNIQTVRLPGTLGMHEEEAVSLSEVLSSFLTEDA
ncbi:MULTISPECIES: alpha/beta hydrolase [unclassified Leptolyngbya]|uniref:alpha/beta fold hydrolase n=1 Tax=unclassified Leptolyngbya TaxID=2650499 RepID=UPI001688DABF|nr:MULTISPECIES: alpha/beta hydrolase [unclassified Leptolyngbya]MBD1909865.1 alpha/beta hydrolase [Leptolyngbya sp. FACHB-8]MBD2156961.1 alpha/beta hydrolase [Leptolyngbya sp. FACHB-16]